MEMGKGFAFVGREYPLPIEGTEEYIDLLFYHLNLHCYVVVEVKVKEFKSRDIGQIGTYINIVDDIVRTNADGKTIGLIICKEKNNVLAKYAVNSSNEPIAISAYELSNFLPDDLASMLPSTEELESRLALDDALEDDEWYVSNLVTSFARNKLNMFTVGTAVLSSSQAEGSYLKT